MSGNGSPVETAYAKAFSEMMKRYFTVYSKEVKLRVVRELKVWIERIFTYQFDFRNLEFSNASENQNTFFKKYNFFNSMNQNLLVNSRVQTRCGRSAMTLRVGKTKMLSEVCELASNPTYSSDGELIEVILTKNFVTMINNIQNTELYRFVKKGSRVFVERHLVPTNSLVDGNIPILNNESFASSFTYDKIDYIPVEIFYSNETGVPEWLHAESSIDLNADFDDKMVKEWEYVKTQMMNNAQYNPAKTGKEMQDSIEKGEERVHDIYDPDGATQSALSYLSQGSVTTDIARSICEYFKNQIRERIFLVSELSGGNNKHTNESLSANVNAFNYLSVRQGLQSESIAKFYWKLIDMSVKYGFMENSESVPDYLELTLQLSRPLELLLSLNSNSTEQDSVTQTLVQENDQITTGGK